ncbi:MAG TPA: helix-turn-helix domain-containing GNAT family N-acetyltransferase [Burkholderiales bacterium]|nr:helix-turn-helix domain-containing GNAT family N-acetyltransferase [Burkholderiales bacterium]
MDLDGHVERVRRFNRFYTGRIGVLPEDYLGSSHSLAEARVLYELGRRGQSTATQLGRELELDLGYISRLLQALKRRGLVQGKAAPEDARRSVLTLTPRGHRSYQVLDARSRREVGELLSALSAGERQRLIGAMSAVQAILDPEHMFPEDGEGEILLRRHRPGDIGWVVEAHGRLYFEEQGWDERFEALVAAIAARFVERFDPKLERCWIAELGSQTVGSVFLAKKDQRTAQLRLLLIEPRARGRGLGKRLVAECIAFARARGYRRIVLWTQSNLLAARHIYHSAGFRLAKRQKHREFGYDLTGEYWQLKLS